VNGFRVIVVLAFALVVGVVAYQMGLSQGVVTALPVGAAPVAYYGYPHWGFGFFGLLFPLLFLFLFFGALRAAWWGRGGHGSRHWGDGRARIEELHRELHGEKPSGDGPRSTST
jgi:hypothetical protein